MLHYEGLDFYFQKNIFYINISLIYLSRLNIFNLRHCYVKKIILIVKASF
jgi:hypothetical protein